jgi:hypothetical protein
MDVQELTEHEKGPGEGRRLICGIAESQQPRHFDELVLAPLAFEIRLNLVRR